MRRVHRIDSLKIYGRILYLIPHRKVAGFEKSISELVRAQTVRTTVAPITDVPNNNPIEGTNITVDETLQEGVEKPSMNLPDSQALFDDGQEIPKKETLVAPGAFVTPANIPAPGAQGVEVGLIAPFKVHLNQGWIQFRKFYTFETVVDYRHYSFDDTAPVPTQAELRYMHKIKPQVD